MNGQTDCSSADDQSGWMVCSDSLSNKHADLQPMQSYSMIIISGLAQQRKATHQDI